jgi:hypothetical protein
MTSAGGASTSPAQPITAAGAHQETIVATARAQGRGHQQSLPDAGFDGMAVAAIGTGLTGAGWLLMLVGSRQLRRRSR